MIHLSEIVVFHLVQKHNAGGNTEKAAWVKIMYFRHAQFPPQCSSGLPWAESSRWQSVSLSGPLLKGASPVQQLLYTALIELCGNVQCAINPVARCEHFLKYSVLFSACSYGGCCHRFGLCLLWHAPWVFSLNFCHNTKIFYSCKANSPC